MSKDTERALDKVAEDQRILVEGLETEIKEDVAKTKGEGRPPKRPWWKVWART
jgi:hypothetical protein